MRSSLFWEITWHRQLVSYGRFGTRYASHVQGSSSSPWAASPLKMEPIGCPETTVTNYISTLLNIPEERRFHLHGGGSLKSRQRLCKSAQIFPVRTYFLVFKHEGSPVRINATFFVYQKKILLIPRHNFVMTVHIFFFFLRESPQWVRSSSFTRFLDQTQQRTTVRRTSLDK